MLLYHWTVWGNMCTVVNNIINLSSLWAVVDLRTWFKFNLVIRSCALCLHGIYLSFTYQDISITLSRYNLESKGWLILKTLFHSLCYNDHDVVLRSWCQVFTWFQYSWLVDTYWYLKTHNGRPIPTLALVKLLTSCLFSRPLSKYCTENMVSWKLPLLRKILPTNNKKPDSWPPYWDWTSPRLVCYRS